MQRLHFRIKVDVLITVYKLDVTARNKGKALFCNLTSLFILVQNPKRNADVRGVEEVSGKDDDCFDEIVLDDLTADF